MLNLPPSLRAHGLLPALSILFALFTFGSPTTGLAQAPVAPAIERADIEVLRGADIVQPQALFYKRVPVDADSALTTEDSIGVVQVPRMSDLDAIPYRDRLLGFTVNVQYAMVVSGGQVIDVQVSDYIVDRTGTPSQEEFLILRPPAEDAFDVAVPDGLECARLVANSDEDLRTRGRLSDRTPCKQVPGVETVVDLAAWYDVSLTNIKSGMRVQPGPGHDARELRGWLRSLAPRGEQIRFAIVVTPPPTQIAVGPAAIRMDTVVAAPTVTLDGEIRVEMESLSTSGFEWLTTLSVLQGPNWSGLPGRPDLPNYRGTRLKGDVSTTLRWRATEEQRYDLTLFGSTQPTLSNDAVGNHHDVPYGLRLGARFGERDNVGMDLRLEGSFEDDPFQRNTLGDGDQRIRLLAGLDRGALPEDKTHWRLSVGPTYFVDRPNIWEARSSTRQLGYSLDGAFDRLLRIKRFATLLDLNAQVVQSWGYISDTGNNNLGLSGRLSLKPRFHFANTYLALGPVVHVGHTRSVYAVMDGFSETNVQFGLEMRSAILF